MVAASWESAIVTSRLPLKTYDVKQENGLVLANIEEELTYEFEDADDDDDDFFK